MRMTIPKLIIALACLILTEPVYSKTFVWGNLAGRLGNQMFQIAATVSLALDNDAEAVFPDLLENPQWDIPCNYKHVFFRLNASRPNQPIEYEYMDPNCPYRPIPYHPNMKIGWWLQSEKYFINHKEEILALFEPSDEIKEYLEEHWGEYISHPKSVSIHFRNYHKENPNHSHIHITYDMNYFEKAIYLFPEDSLFLVFSDDIEWCKENFATLPRNFIFVEGEPHYHDIFLMSMCKHHIISNSSFSWWGAYLSKNPEKKVIAPPKWFGEAYGQNDQDVVPESWTRLSFI